MINVWNSLPDTVSFVSHNAFKHSIVTVDLSNFSRVFLTCILHKGTAAVNVSIRSLAVRLTSSYVFM